MGVTLAQLVKASVGQADVQRFEPHLGHNWLSCSVFLVKSRHFGLLLAQTIRPNGQSLSAGGWSLYKRGVFTKSIPEETRTITVPSLSRLQHDFTFTFVKDLILSLTMEQKSQFHQLLDEHFETCIAKKSEFICVIQAKFTNFVNIRIIHG